MNNETKIHEFTRKEKRLLIGLHGLAFVVHGISAWFAWHMSIEHSSSLLLAEYHYANTSSVEYKSVFGKQNAIHWIALNETITTFSHLIALCIMCSTKQQRFLETIRRWTSYAVTAGLLECAIVIGLGDAHFFGIVFLLVSNAVVQAFGLLIDFENRTNYRICYFALGIGLFLAEAFYVGISASMAEGLAETLPIDFNLLAIIYGLFYTSFGVVQVIRQLDCQQTTCISKKSFQQDRCCRVYCCRNGIQPDAVFVLLSITSKIVLSWSLIGILLTGYGSLGVGTSVNFHTVQWAILLTAICVFVGGIVLNWRCMIPSTKETEHHDYGTDAEDGQQNTEYVTDKDVKEELIRF